MAEARERNPVIVQIYEIQSPQEAEGCIALGVDHLGSVLLSKEDWRRPSIREVMRITEGTRLKNSLIPLFQDEDTIYSALDYYRPHIVHLCDNLFDPGGSILDLDAAMEFQIRLRTRFPEILIMRTIPLPADETTSGLESLSLAHALEPVSDFFLIDTWLGREPVEGYVGITGKVADLNRARDLVLQSGIPVILAGGLSPENVYEALMKVCPQGADSCTLTNVTDPEGRPVRFKKDLARVGRFVREVRRAEEMLRREPSLSPGRGS